MQRGEHVGADIRYVVVILTEGLLEFATPATAAEASAATADVATTARTTPITLDALIDVLRRKALDRMGLVFVYSEVRRVRVCIYPVFALLGVRMRSPMQSMSPAYGRARPVSSQHAHTANSSPPFVIQGGSHKWKWDVEGRDATVKAALNDHEC